MQLYFRAVRKKWVACELGVLWLLSRKRFEVLNTIKMADPYNIFAAMSVRKLVKRYDAKRYNT